ncbi:MAG: TylF/MycF/NovP-related O-methyltransferase [Acidimicrobiales bacterium]
MDKAAALYLDLLKQCLTRVIFLDEEVVDVMGWPIGGVLGDPSETWTVLRSSGMRIVKPLPDREKRLTGHDTPVHAETMIGLRRLESVIELTARVLESNVPGDLVETGVWRGGTIAAMRGVLAAYDDPDRVVWACDSFMGLPAPDLERYPADARSVVDGATNAELSVSVEQVRANISRYGLLDDRVRFVEGWFRDTLPTVPIERIALLRLDGDLYESTMDGLVNLEPKVSSGGYVIIDDFGSWAPCRAAVLDYREAHGITAEIHAIDWTGAYWQKA